MSFVTGFRNLIGRKSEVETGVDVMVEIEAKPPDPEPAVDTDRNVVQRLDDIDVRLGARGTETQQLVERLDARVDVQAAESRQLADQLDQVLELVGEVAQIKQQCARLLERIDEQLDRSQNHDEVINAAVGTAVEAVATRFGEALDRNGESLQQMRDQLDSTARSVSDADERSEGFVHSLHEIQQRTAGLDDLITRIGQTVQEREDEIIELLSRTRRSMTLFAYGGTLAMLLAVTIAAVAVFMR